MTTLPIPPQRGPLTLEDLRDGPLRDPTLRRAVTSALARAQPTLDADGIARLAEQLAQHRD